MHDLFELNSELPGDKVLEPVDAVHESWRSKRIAVTVSTNSGVKSARVTIEVRFFATYEPERGRNFGGLARVAPVAHAAPWHPPHP